MNVSKRDLRQLASALNLSLNEDELSGTLDQIDEKLDDIEGIERVTDSERVDLGRRQWSEPGEDPHNAIVVECHVSTESSGGLVNDMRIGVKDIIAVGGIPMECGSALMRGFVPDRDATVVSRLLSDGAIITAKTNLDPFASGSQGRSFHGRMVNPHDDAHSPGGSSGGSAIAVATGQVDAALGTDMGGSVRIPAAYCGVVGLKPTHGLVPLTHVFENSYTLDHVGPITDTVADAAKILEATAGTDPRDPATMQAAGAATYQRGGYVDAVSEVPDPETIELGVIEEGLGSGTAVSREMVERTETTLDRLADAGVSVRRQSIPGFDSASVLKETISCIERAAAWRSGGHPYSRGGYVTDRSRYALATRLAAPGEDVPIDHKIRLLTGAYLIENQHGRHYERALRAARQLRVSFEEALSAVDALVLPTTPTVAPTLEAADRGFSSARNTYPANVTQLPALSVPNGSIDGLPAGLQLIGAAFDEARLLQIGRLVTSIAEK